MKIEIKTKPGGMEDMEDMKGMEDIKNMEGMDEPRKGQEEDMAGYALDEGELFGETAAPESPVTETPAEKPALADVVPEANTAVEDRIKAIENQLAAAKEKAAEPAPAPAMPGEPPAPAGMSEWEQFKSDYPDIASPVEKMLLMREQTRDQQMAAVHTRIFEEAMDAARPTWRDLRDDPGFGAWLEANPEQQAAAQTPGVRAALKVLDAYESSKKASDVTAQRQERLAGAVATPAKSSRAPALSDTLDGWAAD